MPLLHVTIFADSKSGKAIGDQIETDAQLVFSIGGVWRFNWSKYPIVDIQYQSESGKFTTYVFLGHPKD